MAIPQTDSVSVTLADDGRGGRAVRVAGVLSAGTAAEGWSQAKQLPDADLQRGASIDLSALTYCDVAGAAVVVLLMQRAAPSGGAASVTGASADVKSILDLFDVARLKPEPEVVKPVRIPEQVGISMHAVWSDLIAQVTFLGELTVALAASARRPWKIRWADTFLQIEKVGADAVPITALIGFLVGLIIALTAAIPMQQFGAEVFVANLVGLAMLRELGPLMGAILLAGRSGSAFAAEIGTMKVNDEISALNTMGLDPMRFLVVPRVIAGITMMPFLTVIANVAGLLGGLVVMKFWLGFPLTVYVNQLTGQLTTTDLLSGLAKAFAFGIIVSAVGCMRGMQTQTGPAAVGESTTRSVVTTIVLIVVASGIFTTIYAALGI